MLSGILMMGTPILSKDPLEYLRRIRCMLEDARLEVYPIAITAPKSTTYSSINKRRKSKYKRNFPQIRCR